MLKPQRIASLLASATEILYGLGVGDRVVAVSHECDFPTEVLDKPRATFSRIESRNPSKQIDIEVKQRLASGEPLYQVDWPLLRSLHPDLIVTQAQCDVCAVRYSDVVDAIQSDESLKGTRVAALNPNSIDDLLADIERIGDCVGEPPAAGQFIQRLRERIDAIQHAVSAIHAAERPRVACIEWTEPLMLAGNWIPGLIEMAGGRCELTDSGSHSAYARWQDVIDYDPEVMVIAPCGFDLARSIEEARGLQTIPGWQETTAARGGRIYTVDGSAYFNRSGPRLVGSLEILGHLFHPSRVSLPLPAEQWDQTVARFGD